MIKYQAIKKLNSPTEKMLLELDIEIKEGDFVSLYGPSGSGKTTALRILAGLTETESGYIKVNEETWLDTKQKINLLPQKRELGFVFQDYALFPNMTVKENLMFALKKNQRLDTVTELLEIMDLKSIADSKPQNLSGGQKQRLALARALVRQPKILLLDEPFSALDNEMRIKLQDYILLAHKKWNLTTILVSHDIAEIYKMSDKVIVLEKGKVIKQGTPSQVFSNKKVSGKFQFTGEIVNIEQGDIVFIVSVLIGNNIIKVIATKEEISDLNVGRKVIVSSKAFNPLLIPIA